MKTQAEQQAITYLSKTLFEGQPLTINIRDGQSPLVKAWCFGVLRHYFFYRKCLDRFMRKQSHQQLVCYLYLCFFRIDTTSTQPEVLINTLVEVAKGLSLPSAVVNAILRRYLREKEVLRTKTRGDMQVQYNMRLPLLSMIKKDHEGWRDMVKKMQGFFPLCIMVNAQKTTVAHMAQLLTDAAVEHTQTPHGFVLKNIDAIQSLPGYDKGYFSVVSEGCQQLQDCLPDIKPTKMLDACAAPGGKSLMLRNKYGKKPELHSTDVDISRLKMLNENNERLQLSAKISKQDWASEKSDQTFDFIWADVPCSATGVIAKHPEIAIHPRDDLQNVDKQQAILQNLWEHLDPGGYLVYTTCSLLSAENESQVTQLQKHTGCEQKLTKILSSDHSNDYLFIAVLRKIN